MIALAVHTSLNEEEAATITNRKQLVRNQTQVYQSAGDAPNFSSCTGGIRAEREAERGPLPVYTRQSITLKLITVAKSLPRCLEFWFDATPLRLCAQSSPNGPCCLLLSDH